MTRGSKNGLTLLAAVWLGGLLTGHAAAAESAALIEANGKYRGGDFKAALNLYQKALEAGEDSDAVFYNMGNAYFRNGKKGLALVSYERARRLSPRDRDLAWNMGVLRSALPDRIENLDENLLTHVMQRLSDFFSMDEIAFALSVCLAFLAVFATLIFIQPFLKSRLAFVQPCLLVFLGAIVALALIKWMDLKAPLVVVLDKEAVARYGPSDQETRAFLLHEGAEGRVIDRSGEWVCLSLKNNKSGWIPKASCEIV